MNFTDLISQLGYSKNSPFNQSPYLDIHTPEGLIDMSNTDMDLMGIDEFGNKKKMKAGRKNPYKFEGQKVREIPMQRGGKPPIYTSNPKDARIQAYRDSINVYNADQTYQQAEKKWALAESNLWNQTSQNYDGRNDDYTRNKGVWKNFREEKYKELHSLDSLTEVAVNKSTVPNEPEEEVPSYNFLPIYNKQKKGFDISLNGTRAGFKHPVQPVVYKAPVRQPNMSGQPDSPSIDTLNIQQISNIPNIPARPAVSLTDNTTPTKFSITYPTEGYNQQKSVYFQDKDTWKKAVKGLKGSSTQEGSDYGTATGYLKRGGYNNPYQSGGMTKKQMFDFLFDDEDEPEQKKNIPTAPSTAEVAPEPEAAQEPQEDEDDLAMSMATGNPYQMAAPAAQAHPAAAAKGNPYTGQILSSGQFGDKNIGEYGRQIYGKLATDLGYAPQVNSIYRSKAQQDALIAAGKPAVKNSWHLTGNAIDLKPTDWHRLSNEQQQYYRSQFDVIYHDNHYHIEPK